MNRVNARSPEQRLADRGLRREKGRYVLVQESEVRQRLGEARTTFDAYALVFDRKVQIERDRATVRWLEQQIPTLQKSVGDHNALLTRMPRRSNLEKDQFAEVENERDILEAQLREAREQHDVVASQLPSGQEIRELEVAVANRRQTCESKVEALRGLINSVKERYTELRKDEGLTADLGKSRLGPSPEFGKLDLRTKEIERRLALGAAMMGATR
jgi:hypothetical protein